MEQRREERNPARGTGALSAVGARGGDDAEQGQGAAADTNKKLLFAPHRFFGADRGTDTFNLLIVGGALLSYARSDTPSGNAAILGCA